MDEIINTELENDVILPDGFDPSDENFSVDKFFEEPVVESPTTDTVPTTEDAPVATEQQTPAQESTEPTTAPEVAQMPQTIKVKFNHEDRELSFDEAATYAQKGMNYDKLEERVRAFEAANVKNERLAKQLGYANAQEMIEAAEENYKKRQIRDLVNAGNTEAMAKFLVEQQMAKAASEFPDVPQPQQVSQPSAPQTQPLIPDRRKEEIDEFIKAYPNVNKLPDEVIQANRAGTRLLVAYERYQNKATQNELAILRQNQAAAAKAPVTGVTGKAAPEKPEVLDPFMKGFDEAY